MKRYFIPWKRITRTSYYNKLVIIRLELYNFIYYTNKYAVKYGIFNKEKLITLLKKQKNIASFEKNIKK
ncbi:hypothetical protein FDC19_13275 [Clostridium botulinum]|nr:hypothetical protein [Clostridium botulinum]